MVPVSVLFTLVIYDNGHILSIRAQSLSRVWLFATPGQVVDSGTILDLCMCSVTKSGLTLPFHGLQHIGLPCPSPSPRVHSNSCPLSLWCHPTISSSVAPFLLPSFFPSIRVFSSESALCIIWPKHWSFSFSIRPSVNIQGWFPLGLTGLILDLVSSNQFMSCSQQQRHFS